MSPAILAKDDAAPTQTKLKPSAILHRTPWIPPIATSGQGSYVTIEDGRKLLDAVGGAAVACIGNGHPEVVKAIKDQVDKLSYVYNFQLSNQPAEELARVLIDSGKGAFDQCFFVSGGSEAMEGVIKLARQYFFETKQPQRVNFIARHLSFHGNTLATLSLASNVGRRVPYEAILNHENFHHVSPAYAGRFKHADESEEQYVERLRKELDDKFQELGPDTVIGFAAETVVGATTGVVVPPKGYFKAMKSVCDKYGALFILDEVMSGMGRLGTMHAWEQFGDGVTPDLQSVAKGLGGGYASIGAVLVSKKITDGLRDASAVLKHGHTYQAHPIACAASLAVQKVIVQENLLENSRKQGAYLSSLLHEKLLGPNSMAAPYTFEIRGSGCWWGIEFDFDGPSARKVDMKGRSFAIEVQQRTFSKGLIIMGMSGTATLDGSKGNAVLLSPAYNITKEQVDDIVRILVEAVEEVLRSSARVKAAKEKEKEKERVSAEQQPSASSSSSKRSREAATAKGKGKEVDEPTRATKRARRTTYPIAAPLTINEPAKDLKGKKRAAPGSTSEDDTTVASASAPVKRTRTTSNYSLRSRTEATQSTDMPKKTRSSLGKGKAIAAKSKVATASIPSSSRAEDEDIEMYDGGCVPNQEDNGQQDEDADEPSHLGDIHDDDGHSEDDDEDDDDGGLHDHGPGGGLDTAPMSLFGDFRHIGSFMMGLSTRLKTMLNNIKRTADPTTRLVTLQELSELLSISTEDTLAGSFQVESFVRELVRILGGTGNDPEDGEDDEDQEHDEDAALAAALAMSAGGAYQGDENLEAQVLACRCLANLMEALPGVAHTVVYHGAIPVLCSKLIEISYIDLAEQTLSTLEKISEEFPSAIVREGGLAALLNYLDFFSIAVQRTALQAASNCCRNVSVEHLPMVRSVWPIIRNCLGYADQRLVEYACLCVIRVVDSYYRSSPESLEALVDAELVKALNNLLSPAGGSPLIAVNTFTLLLRALATSARVSSKITMVLLETGIVDILYQILTGVLPPSSAGLAEQGDAGNGQGLGGGIADMTVMENLAHRPKEQIEEALSLVSELMPPLPKDSVFDHKAYTEKSLNRMIKAKAKAERAAARQSVANALEVPAPGQTSGIAGGGTPAEGSPAPESASDPAQVADVDEAPPAVPQRELVMDRTEQLRSKPEVVGRFMQLMVPILVDVYAASVVAPIRLKTLTGLLKAMSFLDADELRRVFTFVPVASFASSILSAKDYPSLVIAALQLIELLLIKLPSEYKPAFRREGVVHELETLAARTLTSLKNKDKDKDRDGPETVASLESALPPSVLPPGSAIPIPGYKKLSSLSLDPDDAITLRARVIKFKHLSGEDANESDDLSKTLQRIVASIAVKETAEQDVMPALVELASLFASPNTSVSSFELLQSGVVEGLLQFLTDSDRTVPLARRQDLFFDAFTARKVKVVGNGQTPFSIFVKKLQESLTRMESFEVVTVAQSIDESKRSSPSLLARQLRLRLVAADDSDIPKNLSNIIVSIHAIATFQALHDYLRPRVAGLMSRGSRLSSMLAALAASGTAASSSAGGFPELPKPSAVLDPATSATLSVNRRRSQRLREKKSGSLTDPTAENGEPGGDGNIAGPATGSTTEGVQDQQPKESASDTVVNDDDFAAEFSDDDVDFDAEVIEDEDDVDDAAPEKTKLCTLIKISDGSKVVAQTPEGTRVATPNPAKAPMLSASTRGSNLGRPSYAAALRTKPSDWHLEFSMDDHKLPLDLTIYGAIHQQEARRKATQTIPPSMIWQGVYNVKFKKVPGPYRAPEGRGDDVSSRSKSPSPSLSSLPEDAPHAKILRLLRILHKLNTAESERVSTHGSNRALPESAFVNNKLTAKLTRQLEEPMIVASSCLPDWALDLPQHFPFLFPFATRYNFLQSTSFGYARLILKWQSQQARGQDSSSRRDEGVGFLGRLQRQKVRISRKHILESAVKVFELYGSSSSILEVEYFEEVGTGLGPTLEFYSLVSKEFARRDLKIWRDTDTTYPGPYVFHPLGLFPSPIAPEDIARDGGQKRTHIFRVIGQFVAKAMLDSRIIDLHVNKIFLKLVLGEPVSLTIDNLKRVDAELAESLLKLRNLVSNSTQSEKMRRKLGMVSVEELALDFTIPGYDIELRTGGRDLAVTSENVEEYIAEVIDSIIGKGAALQAKAFREGFSKVFPVADLKAFTADELVMLFGNSDEDWSIETLSEVVKADHGFNVESRAIHDLLEIMSDYDAPTRRNFLQFVTGSPKLPIGGFRGLNPHFTVVRKAHESPLAADDYLPSVMTCVNYLKLPDYSTKAVMKERLLTAMQEGVGSFHLS
ncbi:hypothetical protein BDY19DRAFT_983799 [Irpex rosettiformis]|uniref:Uncharacterized protein n=1 Tax=Irpex rosettiformis TaxID=378272 RepID=A0ACB8UAW5_9APHY|nr:hypothetical protein BDY19DRAFT_983799 [Irpex rosettiformis]